MPCFYRYFFFKFCSLKLNENFGLKRKDLNKQSKKPVGNVIYYPPPVIQWTNNLVPKKGDR